MSIYSNNSSVTKLFILIFTLTLICSIQYHVTFAQTTGTSWRGGTILWRQVNAVLPNTIRVEFDLITAWDKILGAQSADTLTISTYALDDNGNAVGSAIHSASMTELGGTTMNRPGFLGVRVTSWEEIEANYIPTAFLWVQDRFTFQLNFPTPSVATTYVLTFSGCCRPALQSSSGGPFSLAVKFRPSISGTILTSGDDLYIPPAFWMSRGATQTTDQSATFSGVQAGETEGAGARTYQMVAGSAASAIDQGYSTNPVWSQLTTNPTITWRFVLSTSFGLVDPLPGTFILLQYSYVRMLGNIVESSIPFHIAIYRRGFTSPDVRFPVCPSTPPPVTPISCSGNCPPSDTPITFTFNTGTGPLAISPLLGVPMLLRPISQVSVDASPTQKGQSAVPASGIVRPVLLTVPPPGGAGVAPYPISTILSAGTSKVRAGLAGLTALAVIQQVVGTDPTTNTFGFEICVTRQPLTCGTSNWPSVILIAGSCTSPIAETSCANKNVALSFNGGAHRGNGQYIVSFPGQSVMPVVFSYTATGDTVIAASATRFKQITTPISYILSDPLGCYTTGTILLTPTAPGGEALSIQSPVLSSVSCFRSASATINYSIGSGWTQAVVTTTGTLAPAAITYPIATLPKPLVISPLTNGQYVTTIALSDGMGNSHTLSTTYSLTGAASALSVTTNPTQTSVVAGCSDGIQGVVISAVVNGGQPPYSYQWAYTTTILSTDSVFFGGLAFAQFPAEPTSGVLKLTVTDALGCTISTSARVNSITQPTFSLVSVTPPTAINTPNGAVVLSTGGANAIIQWQNECTTAACGRPCVPATAADTTCTTTPVLGAFYSSSTCLGRYDLSPGTVRVTCRVGACYCNPPALVVVVPPASASDPTASYSPKKCTPVPAA